jgi:hypothetical protein
MSRPLAIKGLPMKINVKKPQPQATQPPKPIPPKIEVLREDRKPINKPYNPRGNPMSEEQQSQKQEASKSEPPPTMTLVEFVSKNPTDSLTTYWCYIWPHYTTDKYLAVIIDTRIYYLANVTRPGTSVLNARHNCGYDVVTAMGKSMVQPLNFKDLEITVPE